MAKRSICTYIILFLLSFQSFAQLPEEKVQWFKDAKFGMFVHWGLYSILGGTYNGHTLPDTTMPNGRSWYAEWVQARLEVPADEYQALAQQFNPTRFNAYQWIKEAKNAGMKYFVITAKHHDGFALWDSKVSDYTIASTPFKDRDILGELGEACKKYGLKFGFYYSHWHDWHEVGGAKPYWREQPSQEDYENYWQTKSLPQVKELIERYDPDLLWFDTWDDESKDFMTSHRRDELISMIRSLSDKCLINGRIAMHNPGEQVDFLEMMDNSYPKALQAKPWQTPATMQHTWGYHTQDYNWKSSSQMIRFLFNNTSKGGNYLLNVGPAPDGTLPMQAIQRLREIGAWMLSNGEAVYGTEHIADARLKSLNEKVLLSQKGNTLFAGIMEDPDNGSFRMQTAGKTPKAVKLLETGRPLNFKMVDKNTLEIQVTPAIKYDNSLRIVEIDF